MNFGMLKDLFGGGNTAEEDDEQSTTTPAQEPRQPWEVFPPGGNWAVPAPQTGGVKETIQGNQNGQEPSTETKKPSLFSFFTRRKAKQPQTRVRTPAGGQQNPQRNGQGFPQQNRQGNGQGFPQQNWQGNASGFRAQQMQGMPPLQNRRPVQPMAQNQQGFAMPRQARPVQLDPWGNPVPRPYGNQPRGLPGTFPPQGMRPMNPYQQARVPFGTPVPQRQSMRRRQGPWL